MSTVHPVVAHSLFALSAIAAIAFALLMVTRRNPIYSALFLILFFATISLDFLLLGAPFLAFMQILVYAGAIMVLYLFVIMLINPREGDLPEESGFTDKAIAAVVSLLTFILLATAISRSDKLAQTPPFTQLPLASPQKYGSVEGVGRELFHQHLLVFELTSILILAAIIGAVHLSLRRVRRTRAETTPPESGSGPLPRAPRQREEHAHV